jgi:hypothetical protein
VQPLLRGGERFGYFSTCMSFTTGTSRAVSTDLVNRRLVLGLLFSMVVHAFVLSLQFGTPGLGMPARIPSISVQIADAQRTPPILAEPLPAEPSPQAPIQAAAPKTVTGMTLLDPLPSPQPLPAPAAAKPAVKLGKPRQARRTSTPLVALEPAELPTRVIAQDQNPDDGFVVPLPRPEESVQKTIDPNEAQDGSDDGTTTANAAAMAAEAEAAKTLADESRKQTEDAARQQAAALAEQKRLAAEQQLRVQAVRAEAAKRDEEQRKELQAALERERARKQAEEQTRQQAAVRQQQLEELAARQKEEQLAERQKMEALTARQQAQELAARQKVEELAARQKADEVARQLADESARQAAQQAAAQQRDKERAATEPRTASNAAPAGEAGNPGATAVVPKHLFSSGLANRARELSKGLGILSGTPPAPRPREDDERTRRRAIVGSAERDVPLRMYVDSWCLKIERNGGLNYTQRPNDKVRLDPLVSVAIRSDGSVEEVTILRSSGRTDTDESVRRIVRLNARYAAFPPNIAARYDVIEIRRIWTFDETLKLLEEVR